VLVKLVWPGSVTDAVVSHKEGMYSFLISPNAYILTFKKCCISYFGT